jgi:hypothetical protein
VLATATAEAKIERTAMAEDGKSRQRDRRGLRLAAALRDNLRKRKEQARGRDHAQRDHGAEGAPAPQPAGEAKEPQSGEPSAPCLPPQHVPT